MLARYYCYTDDMKKDSKPKKETGAAAAWRDRLSQTKSGTKTKTGTSAAANASSMQNRFNKTASGGTARKSRKGMRPG